MNHFFVESIDLNEHPIKKANPKFQAEYYNALKYLVEVSIARTRELRENYSQTENQRMILLIRTYTPKRLKMYQSILAPTSDALISNLEIGLNSVKSCVTGFWKRKYLLMLICDISLILLDDALIAKAVSIINRFLSQRKQGDAARLLTLLSSEDAIQKKYQSVAPLIAQYRLNKEFLSHKENRIIVTANMSAGKSTLINALIGKSVARTSQEVCTGNVCYLYNKVLEDSNVHLASKTLTLCADEKDLHNYEWSKHIAIASHFAHSTPTIPRLCFIDTPGVDAALYKKHADITHNALLYENFDIALYVICPTNLGTDAETRHLTWVAQNIPKNKVIFVLNKLDNYRECADSIEESIQGLREDLLKLGFENPVICPISAYFSYLIKMKMTNQDMSEDELDEYAYLAKKFNRSSYDLSSYYDNVEIKAEESEEITLCKKSGIYGLEKILYGG